MMAKKEEQNVLKELKCPISDTIKFENVTVNSEQDTDIQIKEEILEDVHIEDPLETETKEEGFGQEFLGLKEQNEELKIEMKQEKVFVDTILDWKDQSEELKKGKMAEFEQRASIKFCFKLRKTTKETHRLLRKVYKDKAVTKQDISKWFKWFREGNESLEDDSLEAEINGRLSTAQNNKNIASKVQNVVRSKRLASLRKLKEEASLPLGTIQTTPRDDLKMRRASTQFVPRILTHEQRDNRVAISSELCERCVSDTSFLSTVITGGESWVYGYDQSAKAQSSQRKTSSPTPKRPRESRSQTNIMVIAFFDMGGMVHVEFVPDGVTVDAAFYVEVLKRLREAVKRNRPEKWTNGWLLHHDNAPSHTSLLVREFMAANNIAAVPHPSYSPDLAPFDFWLFPMLKIAMTQKRFHTIEQIPSSLTNRLMLLKKENFQACFLQWHERWNKCVYAEGDYFQGDH